MEAGPWSPEAQHLVCCSFFMSLSLSHCSFQHIPSGPFPPLRTHRHVLTPSSAPPHPQKPSSAMSKSSSTASACTSLPLLQTSQPFCCVTRLPRQSVLSNPNSILTLAGPHTWKGCVYPMSYKWGAELNYGHRDFSRTMNSYSTLRWSHNWVAISWVLFQSIKPLVNSHLQTHNVQTAPVDLY